MKPDQERAADEIARAVYSCRVQAPRIEQSATAEVFAAICATRAREWEEANERPARYFWAAWSIWCGWAGFRDGGDAAAIPRAVGERARQIYDGLAAGGGGDFG